MSTLWISRMCAYLRTREALLSAEYIITHKVREQFRVIQRQQPMQGRMHTTQALLLYEGRCARVYWKHFREKLPTWSKFRHRKAREGDMVNTLLDLGYHHLNTKITQILTRHNVPPSLGFFHIAKTEKSKPFVYDLMELFRADLVDREELRYVRLKKKPIEKISGKDIGKFLKRINIRMERKVYLKEFKQCHTYAYYMELQVLKCMGAVREGRVFHPIRLPKRHETRCS